MQYQTATFKKMIRLSTLALLLMIGGSVGIDQASKYLAEKHLMVWQHHENLKVYQGQRLPLWTFGDASSALKDKGEGFYLAFSFNYIRNQGAAWGFLSDWDDQYRVPFFFLMTVFAIGLIGFYFYTTPPHHRLARFAFALVMSGALGNFTDRLIRGYVVDFLDVRWSIPLWGNDIITVPVLNIPFDTSRWTYNFPNFNWADSCITVGVVFLLIDLLILEALRSKKLQPTTRTSVSS